MDGPVALGGGAEEVGRDLDRITFSCWALYMLEGAVPWDASRLGLGRL